jgi:hypothetical protein
MVALAVALALTAAPVPASKASPAAAAPPPLAVVVAYEHDLADATGTVPLTWPTIALDPPHDEAYVVGDGFVRIFNSAGMEIHRFGDDGSLGHVIRVAVLEDGDIIVLSSLDGGRAYLRCSFRGELIRRFELAGVPDAYKSFAPDQLVHQNGRLYLAERGTMRVLVVDPDGNYRQAFNLADLVAAAVASTPDQKSARSMDGFNVDAQGNLLFTMSHMFAAGIATPSGQVRLFGARGSTPGRFNNVGGIATDEQGYVYVTDRLRAVVSVWSRELKHLGEFGYRGDGGSNLLTPWDIAVSGDRVFVAQAGKRGVKVFRVQITEPALADAEPPTSRPEPAPSRPRTPSPPRSGGEGRGEGAR